MLSKNLWGMLTGRGGDDEKPPDRRSEMRLPVYDSIVVRREGGRREAVDLVGISENGFSFRAASEYPRDQKIVVEASAEEFEAVVRHCTPEGDGFLVGAAIRSRERAPVGVGAGSESGEDQR
jgi:hypothetical protein